MRDREPKPVKNVEVSERHMGLRIAVIVVAVAVALTAFGLGVSALFSESKGWKTLRADTAAFNCGGDFVCNYYLDEDGFKGRRRLEAAQNAYTSACVNAYDIFESETFEGGLASVNGNVNAETHVDPSLYSAFSLMKENGSRAMYLAPVYEFYYSLFYCDDDEYAAQNDPNQNAETARAVADILSFAMNEEHIDLKLLGENTVRLEVSKTYADFLSAWEDPTFLDFFIYKNAFIADYIAEYMSQRGFYGTVSSVDGFTRSFLSDGLTFELNVFDLDGEFVNLAATLTGRGDMGVVRFRDYGISPARFDLFYTYADGVTVTPYLDAEGKNRSCIHDLLTYSYEAGCAYTLLKSLPLYTAETLVASEVSRLCDGGIFSVYCSDFSVRYNDASSPLRIALSGDRAYTLQPLP